MKFPCTHGCQASLVIPCPTLHWWTSDFISSFNFNLTVIYAWCLTVSQTSCCWHIHSLWAAGPGICCLLHYILSSLSLNLGCPWPAAAAETGKLTEKARTWIGCVSSTALKSCAIFWYQRGWREGHSRLALIHTQAGHPFRFIINVNVFSSCSFIVSLFSGIFLWGPFGVLGWPHCFFIYRQVLGFTRLLAVAIPPRHCNSAQH